MASYNSNNWLYKGINREVVIDTIQKNHLEEVKEECWIKNCIQVGSYNWSDSSACTIIVPGSAKAFKNSGLVKLQKSYHEQMVDENRHRQPEYPLESLFRAVRLCNSNFAFKDVDFMTDRNNLRKLFNFVDGSVDKSFRIDFQKIGNLVFFVRQEEKNRENCNDYGKSFEENFTSGNEPGSFRKIITYDLAGFKMLVRFEVDCIEKDVLAEAMEKMTLASSSSNKKTVEFEDSNLKCQLNSDAGKVIVNQEVLMELTTKGIYKGRREFPKHKWNQLFFSQTDYLVIGWHEFGNLRQVRKYSFDDVSRECGKTKNSISSELKKFSDLLSIIKSIPTDDGVYSIIYDKDESSVLKFYRCNTQVPKALPESLIKEIH